MAWALPSIRQSLIQRMSACSFTALQHVCPNPALCSAWLPVRPGSSARHRTLPARDMTVNTDNDTTSNTKGMPFNVKGFYLGAEVNLQAAAEKLSTRCLSVSKDFSVFTLGPTTAVKLGPEKQARLNAMYTGTPPTRPHHAPDGSEVLYQQLQLITARRPAAPPSAGQRGEPRRLTLAMSAQHRTNLITEEHLLEHVNMYGVMIVFKFGSIVFFEPKPRHTPAIPPPPPPPAPKLQEILEGAHPSPAPLTPLPSLLEGPAAAAPSTSASSPATGKPPRAPAAQPEASSATSKEGSNNGTSSKGATADAAAAARRDPAPSDSAARPKKSDGQAVSKTEADKQAARAAQAAQALAQQQLAELKQELKRVVRSAVTDPVPTSPREEEASVVVRPNLKRPLSKETDRLAISEIDLGNLEIICRVVGQSAALHFYTGKVDDSLRDFEIVLADLAANAAKPFFHRPMLYSRLRGGKLLATISASSLMYNKVVSKLGLLDTSRTAWESDEHDIVWKGLKREFELEQRFENLLKKLDIYKEESRFILEVRNERGTANAEKVIILLIALEIVVNAAFHLYH